SPRGRTDHNCRHTFPRCPVRALAAGDRMLPPTRPDQPHRFTMLALGSNWLDQARVIVLHASGDTFSSWLTPVSHSGCRAALPTRWLTDQQVISSDGYGPSMPSTGSFGGRGCSGCVELRYFGQQTL